MTTVFFFVGWIFKLQSREEKCLLESRFKYKKKDELEKDLRRRFFCLRVLYTNTVHIFQQGYFLSGGYLNCDLEKKNVYSRVYLNRRKKMNRKKICVADFFNFFYTCIFSSKVFLFIFQIIKICSLY